MKTIKLFGLPLVLIIAVTASNIFFQSCEPEVCEEEEGICDSCAMVYKPNIYIYPEKEIYLNVTLDFPKGGKVIVSIPEYGNGWDISVDENGKINDKYDYLFYESSQPDVWQLEKGWVISRENLHDFFVENMSEYGFAGREIQDFTDYWIPRLTASGFYAIYPQTNSIINSVIELNVSQEADNVLRLFYVIQETAEQINTNLASPKTEYFNREGFFITEWGVVLK